MKRNHSKPLRKHLSEDSVQVRFLTSSGAEPASAPRHVGLPRAGPPRWLLLSLAAPLNVLPSCLRPSPARPPAALRSGIPERNPQSRRRSCGAEGNHFGPRLNLYGPLTEEISLFHNLCKVKVWCTRLSSRLSSQRNYFSKRVLLLKQTHLCRPKHERPFQ